MQELYTMSMRPFCEIRTGYETARRNTWGEVQRSSTLSILSCSVQASLSKCVIILTIFNCPFFYYAFGHRLEMFVVHAKCGGWANFESTLSPATKPISFSHQANQWYCFSLSASDGWYRWWRAMLKYFPFDLPFPLNKGNGNAERYEIPLFHGNCNNFSIKGRSQQ